MTRNETAALAELSELEGTKPTQERIAKALGVTQGRVAQIEARALKKLAALLGDEWQNGIQDHHANGLRERSKTLVIKGSYARERHWDR